MALRKLPFEVQSKFRASTQIRSFKAAIEELVYNALDAKSTSIAIRVNIKESYIQVIDNGHGVTKDDFKILGQRYTTSKYDHSTTSESIQMYGNYGQSLANLIEVSQSVRIISKCKNNMETWMKHFCNGKEEACSIMAERPSVGTTVEIKGLLYNLTIQKKAVNALQELQNIKTFLEQISLIHCNASFSLRDNSENEIVFKVHKNRDVIQTLSSVLSISIANIQEFQVEKNLYKVTGFIRNNTEDTKGYQWIFVNGRFVENSNLHNIVNENLAKGAPVRNNIKTKNYNNGKERVATSNKLPDYFIFVKCPKNEYDIISNPKQSILEFKNVIHINKLLEKLVKFYMGDIQKVKVKITKEPVKTPENKKARETDTRNKVKQIIQKVLGTQQKKLNGSNLRNGVKGKIMRRVKKKRHSAKSRLNLKDDINQEKICEMNDLVNTKDHTLTSKHCVNNESLASFQVPKSKPMKNKRLTSSNHQRKHPMNEKRLQVMNIVPTENKYNNTNKQPVLCKFEKETNEVHKRCNILAKKVDDLLGVKKKRKCKIFTNETIQYSNNLTNNKSISVRKKIKEIIIHEYVPKLHNVKTVNKNDKNIKDIIKSNDLLCPITKIMKKNDFARTLDKFVQVQPDPNYLRFTDEHDTNIPGPTYESHGYLKDILIPRQQVDLVEKDKKGKFISNISRDNLASPVEDRNLNKKERVNKRLHDNKIKASKVTDTSSYSIHFTKTESQMNEKRNTETNEAEVILFSNNDHACIGSTYTIAESEELENKNVKKISSKARIETTGNQDINLNLIGNVNAYSEPCVKKIHNETAVKFLSRRSSDDGIHEESRELLKCEGHTYIENPNVNVVFISNSPLSKTGSNYFDALKMCEAIMDCHGERDYEETIDNTFVFDSTNDVESNIPNVIQTEKCFEPDATHICRNLEDDGFPDISLTKIEDCDLGGNILKPNEFNLKNRRRYIPKGMSPIFENCNLKNICDYQLAEDYFEETVYNNFAQNVQIHSEIFEPRIQNVKDSTTRDIQRVDMKLNKDIARLTFNARSLKHAKVLGQVDNKFIATIMNGDSNGAHDSLVLLDQHAVHERIRLEQNLSEYITHDQWKSVSVDRFSLKLNRDEILYLHNYRDKFERLGLQWCIASDTEVMINAIPEAILGKHQRQVNVVLKAVKSLIKEEINIIKEQGGCVSLHPKSIMDLVFSEACRYAIMFGDLLSVRECSELVEALSHCRTPFQCAHGRPALAVLVDVARETRPYMVNFKKIELFRRNQTKSNK